MGRPTLEREVIGQLRIVLEEVRPVMESFSAVAEVPEAGRLPTSFMSAVRFTLVLSSPFAYRAFHKHLGYAGDYEMVNMVRDPCGEDLCLASTGLSRPLSHRPQPDQLSLQALRRKPGKAQAGKRTRILNLGCGPAHEIQRFLKNEDVSDLCDLTLLDFNAETIEQTEKVLNRVRTQSGRVTPINLMQRSVHQLLRQATTGDTDLQWESYDFVYCAGLFDYLSQRVCRRLNDLFVRLLAPGDHGCDQGARLTRAGTWSS